MVLAWGKVKRPLPHQGESQFVTQLDCEASLRGGEGKAAGQAQLCLCCGPCALGRVRSPQSIRLFSILSFLVFPFSLLSFSPSTHNWLQTSNTGVSNCPVLRGKACIPLNTTLEAGFCVCVCVPYRVEEVPSLFQVYWVLFFFYHELMFGFYQMLFLHLCVTLVICVFCPPTHLFFFFGWFS